MGAESRKAEEEVICMDREEETPTKYVLTVEEWFSTTLTANNNTMIDDTKSQKVNK